MHEDFDVNYGRRGSSNMGSMLMGFLIGGLIGAAATLLMAPRSGPEIRSLLRDKSMELKDMATDKLDQTRSRAEHVLDDTRSMASEKIRSVAGKAESVARKASDKMDDAAQRAGQIEQNL